MQIGIEFEFEKYLLPGLIIFSLYGIYLLVYFLIDLVVNYNDEKMTFEIRIAIGACFQVIALILSLILWPSLVRQRIKVRTLCVQQHKYKDKNFLISY